MTGQDASHPLFANRDRTLMITKAFIFIETTMNSLASLSQLVYAEVLMLQLRASGVGVMLHLSLKNVIGQRRRVARSNTTQSVSGSTRHNRWVGAILADMNIPFNTTHFSFSNFGEKPSSITSIYIPETSNSRK